MQITHIIIGLNNGGAEASLFRLVTNDKQNIHSIISIMDEGKYGRLLQDIGINVYCLNMPRGKITYQGLRKLWSLLKEIKPNLVQTWMYHADFIGGLIAKAQGIPCIWNIRHSDLSPQKNSFSTLIIARLCAGLSYAVPTKIISCAYKAADIHKNIGYAKNKFVIIPNGYNFEKFTTTNTETNLLKTQLNLPNNTPILGMVARFDPQKDHYNLLQALHYLHIKSQDFRCFLIGHNMDSNNKKLVQWIEYFELIDKVILLGQRSDIPLIMSVLDIHVLSSIGEAFPNVLAEAMACGTLCVTTDVGDASLIVGDTGWVVPPSDSQALAEAISSAIQTKINNSETWALRKQAARNAVVNKYNLEKMVDSYRAVWRNIYV